MRISEITNPRQVILVTSRWKEKEEAEIINCPGIKQALGYLECEVVDEIETGDHILFIGRVTKAELRKRGVKLFHISGDKLGELEGA